MRVAKLVHVPRSPSIPPGQRLGLGQCARRSSIASRAIRSLDLRRPVGLDDQPAAAINNLPAGVEVTACASQATSPTDDRQSAHAGLS
jgi:hypothetical protein